METIILYVDDAVYAREHLAKLAPGVPVALDDESASTVPDCAVRRGKVIAT